MKISAASWVNGLAQDFDIKLFQVKTIAKAELKSKIFNKSLGVFWYFLESVISASLYYILSNVLLGANVPDDLFVTIFTAVIFWRWFNKTVDSSPTALSMFAPVFKQQAKFSIEVAMMSFMMVEFVLFLASLVVLVGVLNIYGYGVNTAYIYLPFLVLSQFTLTYLFSKISALIGLFFKDFGSILYGFTSIWWYLSPGIYDLSKVPQSYMWWYEINPFTYLLLGYKDILLKGEVPDMFPIGVIAFLSIVGSVITGIAAKNIRKYFYLFM